MKKYVFPNEMALVLLSWVTVLLHDLTHGSLQGVPASGSR